MISDDSLDNKERYLFNVSWVDELPVLPEDFNNVSIAVCSEAESELLPSNDCIRLVIRSFDPEDDEDDEFKAANNLVSCELSVVSSFSQKEFCESEEVESLELNNEVIKEF